MYSKHELLLYIYQIPKATNFVFNIVYCIWMAGPICIFADTREGGLFMDEWISLYSFEDHIIHLLLSWMYLHMPLVLYKTVLIYKHIWSMRMSKRLILVQLYVCYAILSLTPQNQHYWCFGPSWVFITCKLYAKYDNCSFLDWSCLYQ